MLVDLGRVQIHKSLHFKIFMLVGHRRFRKIFKTMKGSSEPFIISQVKMCVQNIVHAFYIVTRFHGDHDRMFIEKINPFLSITIIF